MLIRCPECGKKISDKVEACPYCGVPQPAAARLSMLEARRAKVARLLVPAAWVLLLAAAVAVVILFRSLFAP